MGDAEVLDGLASALALWSGPDGYAARAAHDLAEHNGQSADMLRFGLERLLSAHSRDALAAWLADSRVEAARAVAARRADGQAPSLALLRGPNVIAQILAGNVAGLGIAAAVEGLLARSAVLLKPASGDPVTSRLFKEALDRAAPQLGKAIVVRSWSGGDARVEDEVFNRVDFVVASGGEEMAVALHERLRTPHLIYGPRVSIGVIGMGWHSAPESWWEEVVREIVLWDQQGCLSPRILFVAGDQKRFARRLAEAMKHWETVWPARPRAAAESAAVHGFRSPYQMAGGTDAGCIEPGNTAWTVVWDSDPTLHAGPPLRVVRVTRRIGMRVLKPLLSMNRGRVQGMGTAFLASHDLAWRRVAESGEVPRTAPLTSIQEPPAGWRADGRSGLAELLAHGVSE
jgi:hypothetical protein